ncbi:hypothetical protein M406DRAFT_357075 [Cryphonectria parasitica EP155]|uniref:Uncharacterized protein n=1 Tax=Cryphonectria parasitica (strain ATCC 38755 / EP155) TaxID=660469 RepID=A0A9P4XZ27_CRYP1|nr:uncharacterized protein M406DRAFT_357075 [Cryphonectria parasitica EP155]KAF3763407.1 hypothetical protein M406DRAFT_357075 [Cryphonectria parasitica EP155]
MSALHPVNPPVGRLDFVNAQQETTIILKEKVLSLTGDAFDIKVDPRNGRDPYPVLKVDPSLLTSKRAFFDMTGNHLFDLKKEHLHLVHEYMKLIDVNGEKFCEIKKNLKVGFGSKFTITFTQPGGAEQVLVMEGNWRDSVAEIKREGSGEVCAVVHRKSAFKSLSTFLFDQNTYSVTVAPGVDYAAIAAVCIVFDEWENDAL